MKIGDPHRMDRTLVVQRRRARLIRKGVVGKFSRFRVLEIKQRLGDGEEQQTNPNTSREQHREPRDVREIRPRIFITKPNVAVPAAHQEDADREHDAKGADVVTAECGFNPTADGGIDTVGKIHIQCGEDHEGHEHAFSGQSHAAVQSRKNPDFATIPGAFPISSAIADLPLLFSTRDRQIHESTRPNPATVNRTNPHTKSNIEGSAGNGEFTRCQTGKL